MAKINKELLYRIAVECIGSENLTSVQEALGMKPNTFFRYMKKLKDEKVIQGERGVYQKGPNYELFLAENKKYAKKKKQEPTGVEESTALRQEISELRNMVSQLTVALQHPMQQQVQQSFQQPQAPNFSNQNTTIPEFMQKNPEFLDVQSWTRPKGLSRKGYKSLVSISYLLANGVPQADIAKQLNMPRSNVSYWACRAEELGIIKMTQKSWQAFYEAGPSYSMVQESKFPFTDLVQKMRQGAQKPLFAPETEFHDVRIVIPVKKRKDISFEKLNKGALDAWEKHIAGNLRKHLKLPDMTIVDEGENIVLNLKKFRTRFGTDSEREAKERVMALSLQAVDVLRRNGYVVDILGIKQRFMHIQNQVQDEIDPERGSRTITSLGRNAVSLFGEPMDHEAQIWTGENSPKSKGWMDFETNCAYTQTDINLMPLRIRRNLETTGILVSCMDPLISLQERHSKNIETLNESLGKLAQVLVQNSMQTSSEKFLS